MLLIVLFLLWFLALLWFCSVWGEEQYSIWHFTVKNPYEETAMLLCFVSGVAFTGGMPLHTAGVNRCPVPA